MSSLVWFRRDLRVHDNSALYHACKESDEVVGLFVFTPEQWKQHDDADAKISFWIENLRCLSDELDDLNIPLIIRSCDSFAETPKLVVETAEEHNCSKLFFNREYEVNEHHRDAVVIESAQASDIEVTSYHDRIIVPPREIETKEGKFYSVFTPYRKVWDTKALDFAKVLRKPTARNSIDVKADSVPDSIAGFDFSNDRADLWKPGEAEAKKRLKKFVDRIDDYDEARDVPSQTGTSLLSPYLNAGVISPRQCLAAALKHNDGNITGSEGATTWISELTWRDFYTHVMVGFPRVSRHHPFKKKTEGIPWRYAEDDFQAWCEGRTGYPIVDAGMRQLNQTGWMHNRLRMVTAMFLTKNLLIDWRWGEKYFMQKLVDGDLAANNGGWQWSASTGTDSVPYFRIFNPFSQSKRFDVDGTFIKKLCPELEAVPSSALHDQKKLAAALEKHDVDYPAFVVDYKAGRERALEAFKSL
ncbi:deoxyribodipyrimidine photo-lyase [Mariniblastus fucicola]|uniref:Deoxyribodipyrimidine photo-lyase n=1 Tax=Mariniblastus fucicola TaxID=980251 RepID=A0A5B9PI25_9BACT|nr:deoxyribodipyrimidine photo-lyase [Mariniblastus fucicola]QEG24326.1 Deoxyribodipyrimidine photo-lyase [Mariniblastus fucicola]